MPNSSRAKSARTVATMMLGGVPISVTSPPSSEPKESGISSSRGARSVLRAICRTTGIIRANAPTLFMKPDNAATRPAIIPTCSEGPSRASVTRRTIQAMASEFCSARLITSTAATVITAGWPKPTKAWSGGTMPPSSTAISAISATTS